jgi:glycosyltransferase involved in cell wall biosynthesis
MSLPFFSIVVPTYNRASFLHRSIASVQAQSFADWELLIVDDGSVDHTKEIVESYAKEDGRIRYFNQKNQGASAARNQGLQNARGKFICFVDSDDEFEPHHLEIFYKHISASPVKYFYYTQFRFRDGEVSSDYAIPQSTKYEDAFVNNVMKVFLPYSPPVQTICLPAEIKEVVRFNSELFVSECYDFGARCASLFEVAHIPEVTVTLHGHADNTSVPRNIDQSIRFNERQIQEFGIMTRDKFYDRIKTTSTFRRKMQGLHFDLAKNYAKKKNFSVAFGNLFSGLKYAPSSVFSIGFALFLRGFLMNSFARKKIFSSVTVSTE